MTREHRNLGALSSSRLKRDGQSRDTNRITPEVTKPAYEPRKAQARPRRSQLLRAPWIDGHKAVRIHTALDI
jgi:hypothetical protein